MKIKLKIISILCLMSLSLSVFCQKMPLPYTHTSFKKKSSKFKELRIRNDSISTTVVNFNSNGTISNILALNDSTASSIEVSFNHFGKLRSIKHIHGTNNYEIYKIYNGRLKNWKSVNLDTKTYIDQKNLILMGKASDTIKYASLYPSLHDPLHDSSGIEIIINPKNRKIQAINFDFTKSSNEYFIDLWKNSVNQMFCRSKSHKALFSLETNGILFSHVFEMYVAQNKLITDNHRYRLQFRARGKLLTRQLYNNGVKVK